MKIGANVNLVKTGESLNTTLHYVVNNSIGIDFIRCLFDCGAKIDALDNNKSNARNRNTSFNSKSRSAYSNNTYSNNNSSYNNNNKKYH